MRVEKGGTVSNMAARVQRGVDLIVEVPRWSERWVLEDGVTMPESIDHQRTGKLLLDVLLAWVQRTGRDATAGSNLAVRWDEAHPTIGADPDVYVVEPALPDGTRSLLTWEPGRRAPLLAVEVVSRDTAKKDYLDAPAKYAASGTTELWVFDPERRGRGWVGGRWALQVWRRSEAGAFRREYAGDGPVYSEALGAWAVVTDGGKRLRVADDAAGERLWPTAEEAERERADAERERADAERERAKVAEAEVTALRATLAAMHAAR
jgi:Uma2 family endonuclease